MKGTIVIGHGSRSKDAEKIFFKVVDALKEKMGGAVEGCFMELSLPDISTMIERFYQKGIREIIVLPYFLFEGMHIKQDIPEILREVKAQYPDMQISMARPIEFHPLLVDILLERIEGETQCI